MQNKGITRQRECGSGRQSLSLEEGTVCEKAWRWQESSCVIVTETREAMRPELEAEATPPGSEFLEAGCFCKPSGTFEPSQEGADKVRSAREEDYSGVLVESAWV